MVVKDAKAKSPLANKLSPANQVTTVAKELERREARVSVDLPWWQQASKLSHYTQERVRDKGKIPGDDLYFCSRPFLLAGKILGLVPLQGLWSPSLEGVGFRLRSVSTGIGVVQILCVTSLAVMSVSHAIRQFFGEHLEGGGDRSVILNARGPILLAYSSIVQCVLLRNAGRFVKLLNTWRTSSAALNLTVEKISIYRRVNILAFGVFLLGIVHFYVLIISRIGLMLSSRENAGEQLGNVTFLEYYYSRSSWSPTLPYHPGAMLLIFVTRLFSIISAQYAEGLLLLLAKLLAFKFQTLYEQAKFRISPPKNISNTLTMFRKTSIEIIWRENVWNDLRKDHLICVQLLRQTDQIISPLVFLFYAVNIYLVCLQIHQGITPADNNNSIFGAVLSALSLVSILTRIILMSLMMARINESAHSVIKCIQKCPNHLYTSELERLERMLSNNTIGLSGLGCFVVTKAFLLVVGSVIFTFQVVLVQVVQTQAEILDILPLPTNSP